MATSNFLISRLNNTNFTDQNVGQGFPFLKIVTINSDSPNFQIKQMANGISTSLSGNDLAFMDSGSLMSLQNKTYYYQSPFATNTEIPTAQNVIGNNPATFAAIIANSTYPVISGNGLQGVLYVSPFQGKFILQNITNSSTGSFSFNVFYNPMNRSNLSDDTIKKNIANYCGIVGNVDPLCYCVNGSQQCANQILAGSGAMLKSKSESDYNTIANNCAYLSPMCNAWGSSGNAFVEQEISASKSLNGVSACGNNFMYSSNSGVVSSNGVGILDQCGLTTSTTSAPTGPSGGYVPVSTSPQPSGSSPQPSGSSPAQSHMLMIIGISVVIFILIVVIGIKFL